MLAWAGSESIAGAVLPCRPTAVKAAASARAATTMAKRSTVCLAGELVDHGVNVVRDVVTFLDTVDDHALQYVDHLRREIVQLVHHRAIVSRRVRIGDKVKQLISERFLIDTDTEKSGHGRVSFLSPLSMKHRSAQGVGGIAAQRTRVCFDLLWRTSCRRVWPLGALIVWCCATQTAYAHAYLTGEQPAPRYTLGREPARVTLYFSEAVSEVLSTIEVHAAGDRRVDAGGTRVRHGNMLYVDLRPGAGAGTYAVVWRVVSALDGHATFGSYTFNVVRPGGELSSQSTAQGAAGGIGVVVARWFELVTSGLWLGTMVIAVFILPSEEEDGQQVRALSRTARRRISGWVPGCLVVLLGSSSVSLGLQIHAIVSSWARVVSPPVILAVLRTPFGALWLVRQGVVVAGLLLTLVGWSIATRAVRTHGTKEPWGGPIVRDYIFACAVGYDLVLAASGHATDVPVGGTGILSLGVLLDWVHVLASGLWVGGIMAIAALLIGFRSTLGARESLIWSLSLLNRFSPVAYGSVIALAVTGPFNATVHLGSVPALWDTTYGQALVVKISSAGSDGFRQRLLGALSSPPPDSPGTSRRAIEWFHRVDRHARPNYCPDLRARHGCLFGDRRDERVPSEAYGRIRMHNRSCPGHPSWRQTRTTLLIARKDRFDWC